MDWFKKESKDCTKQELDAVINDLRSRYRISAELVYCRGKLLDKKYRVETWVNLNSHNHIVNIYGIDYLELDEGDQNEVL